MKTKAELEDEITALKTRIAELEGMVYAYQYALSRFDNPQPQPIQPYQPAPWYQPFDTWPGLGVPPGQPVWSNTSGMSVYNLETTE